MSFEEEEFDESKFTKEDYTDVEHINIEDYKVNTDICLHNNIHKENDIEICVDCGLEISKNINLDAEWHYYGDNDVDPSRCQLRKCEEKTIYKDIEKFDFPYSVKEGANNSYMQITDGKIRRANFRKCLISACIFKEYQNQNIVVNPEEIRDKFGLSKKEFSKGLIHYNLHKKNKNPPTYISPTSFIPRIMSKFNTNEYHINKVNELYDMIKDKSKLLNRSNPQSVISGLIFYYFKLIGGNITSIKFSKIVNLSDITVTKISKNISDILGTADKITIN